MNKITAIKSRYYHNANFHRPVETIVVHIKQKRFRPIEIIDAAILAALIHGHTKTNWAEENKELNHALLIIQKHLDENCRPKTINPIYKYSHPPTYNPKNQMSWTQRLKLVGDKIIGRKTRPR